MRENMEKRVKNTRNVLLETATEFKDDPWRKFKTAFVLMSIIPILVFLSLFGIGVLFFPSLSVSTIVVLILVAVISLLGFISGYEAISQTLQKLMSYTAQLKKSEQLKSALVANVSHEVRNPLTTVKLIISNLLDGLAGQINEAQKSLIQRCEHTVDRLIHLVNDLLDLSKIEAGKFTLKRALIDVERLIDTEIENFNPVLKNKNLSLIKESPAAPLKIWGDGDKITQAFFNLFDNAVKYTPENGRISVKWGGVEGYVWIEIKDTGIGIPEEKKDKIFDKFERLMGSKEFGTGLGLPIAKDIVEMHRGRILVDSIPGKGSKFTVVLPVDLREGGRNL